MSPRTRSTLEAEGMFALKLKPGTGLCCVKGCRKDIGRKDKMGLCHAHYQYRWRMKSPKPSAYATLKTHALARGIKFTICYQYFLGITDSAMYWTAEDGMRPSIDRVDPTKGYEPGNIRVISISENIIKGNRERHLPEVVQALLARKNARGTLRLQEPALAGEDDQMPF